mmetsp:Transcript_29096/g.89968  ORF Transcript_29096/g.89968 Transcript_29096/m.89968 type:complete len:231 (-) Transcript_29096:64-756(-)
MANSAPPPDFPTEALPVVFAYLPAPALCALACAARGYGGGDESDVDDVWRDRYIVDIDGGGPVAEKMCEEMIVVKYPNPFTLGPDEKYEPKSVKPEWRRMYLGRRRSRIMMRRIEAEARMRYTVPLSDIVRPPSPPPPPATEPLAAAAFAATIPVVFDFLPAYALVRCAPVAKGWGGDDDVARNAWRARARADFGVSETDARLLRDARRRYLELLECELLERAGTYAGLC